MKRALVLLADGCEELEAVSIVDVLRRGGAETAALSIAGRTEIAGAHGIRILADGLFDSAAAASAAAGAILFRANRPTALVCANDNLALAVYRAAGALGLAIPRDLSVTGFDDIDLAPLLSPPLTTVVQISVSVSRSTFRDCLPSFSRIISPSWISFGSSE